MARQTTVRREQHQGAAVEPRTATGGPAAGSVVALVLFVVAVAALGEVVADRVATRVETPHPSSWESVQRIGDAARARGDAAGARRAYLTALFRARGERSLVGVLSAAEGFKALGDREVVEHALRIAASLGHEGDGAGTGRRLTALRDRLDATDALPIAIHARR
jgi:hypothetical protein